MTPDYDRKIPADSGDNPKESGGNPKEAGSIRKYPAIAWIAPKS